MYPKFIQFLHFNNFYILILILLKQTFVSKDANHIDISITYLLHGAESLLKS